MGMFTSLGGGILVPVQLRLERMETLTNMPIDSSQRNKEEAVLPEQGYKTERAGTKDKTGKPILSISVAEITQSKTSPSTSTSPPGVFHTPNSPSPMLEFPVFLSHNKSAVQLGDLQEDDTVFTSTTS